MKRLTIIIFAIAFINPLICHVSGLPSVDVKELWASNTNFSLFPGEVIEIKTSAIDNYGNPIKDYTLELINNDILDYYDVSFENNLINIKGKENELKNDHLFIIKIGIKDGVFVRGSYLELRATLKLTPYFEINPKIIIHTYTKNPQKKDDVVMGYISLKSSNKSKEGYKVESDNPALKINIDDPYTDNPNVTIEINPTKVSSDANAIVDKITIKRGPVSREIEIYLYPKQPLLNQPVGKYTGWLSFYANANNANCVPLADAPGSLDPKLYWQQSSHLSYSNYDNYVPNIISMNNMFFYINDNLLYCFNLGTGENIWSKNFEPSDTLTDRIPIYELINASNNKLLCSDGVSFKVIDSTNGNEIFTISGDSEESFPKPSISLIDENNLYIGGDQLKCYNYTTKKLIWNTKTRHFWHYNLCIKDSNLFCISDYLDFQEESILAKYNKTTGKEIWEKKCGSENLNDRDDQKIVLTKNYILLNNRYGWSAYEIASGKRNVTGYQSSPIVGVYNDLVIFKGFQNLNCIDVSKEVTFSKGLYVWNKKIDRIDDELPVAAGNRVYVYLKYFGISCIDAQTGKLLSENITNEPKNLDKWVRVIPTNGCLLCAYKSSNNELYFCCYANNNRFKKEKKNTMIMSANSNRFICSYINTTQKEYTLPVKPYISEDLLYIPTKNIFDIVGGKIEKSSDNRYTLKFLKNTLTVTPGKSNATLNGKSSEIDPKNPKVVARLESGIILLPYGFFTNCMGLKAYWEKITKTVIIASNYLE